MGRTLLAKAGPRRDADFDLWTALTAGLASQQVAHDPGGDRYTRLVDDAVAMFAAHALSRNAEAAAGNSGRGSRRAAVPHIKDVVE